MMMFSCIYKRNRGWKRILLPEVAERACFTDGAEERSWRLANLVVFFYRIPNRSAACSKGDAILTISMI